MSGSLFVDDDDDDDDDDVDVVVVVVGLIGWMDGWMDDDKMTILFWGEMVTAV